MTAHAATRLARFKRPTIVEMVDELPHSATGKVAKGRLREGERDQRGRPGDDPRVTLIGKPGCHLCDEAREVVARVTAELGEDYEELQHPGRPRAAARGTGSRSRSRWSTASSTTSGGCRRPGCGRP